MSIAVVAVVPGQTISTLEFRRKKAFFDLYPLIMKLAFRGGVIGADAMYFREIGAQVGHPFVTGSGKK